MFLYFHLAVIGVFDTICVITQFITLGLVESVDKYDFTATIHFSTPFMMPIKGYCKIDSGNFLGDQQS